MSTLHDVHTVWDDAIAPQAEVESGETVEFEVTDASGGQLDRDSGVAAVAALGNLDIKHLRAGTRLLLPA